MPDLEDLYREIILDHYRSPRNRGQLPVPPAHREEGFNPLCGDELVVTFVVEDGRLADVRWEGTGCSISQSSASLMTAAIKGKSLDQVHEIISTFKSMMSIHQASLGDAGDDPTAPAEANGAVGTEVGGVEVLAGEPEPIDLERLGELAALQGVVKFPVRIKCATLSWNTLAQGLDAVEAAPSPT